MCKWLVLAALIVAVTAGAIALVGSIGDEDHATRARKAADTVGASALPQCLRGYGARFVNFRSDATRVGRSANHDDLVIAHRFGGSTLYVWSAPADPAVRRTYLLSENRGPTDLSNEATRRLAQTIVAARLRHRREASGSVVLFSDMPRRQTSNLDRVCLRQSVRPGRA